MDLLRTKGLSELDLDKLKADNESFLFMKSRFRFLNDHFGLRPGCMHLILSTTGSGKTTLAQSLIAEILNAGRHVLVYSTEENDQDVATKISYSDRSLDTSTYRIFEEDEMLRRVQNNKDNAIAFLNQLEFAFNETKPEVFIFDNITTSQFYDQNKKIAVEVAMGLKSLCRQLNIPFIVIAHTAAHIKSNFLFDSSAIRGFRNIANTAQYLYCLTRFVTENAGMSKQVSVLFTDKSRNHDEASRSYYRLFYDSKTKLYNADDKISYANVKEFLRG